MRCAGYVGSALNPFQCLGIVHQFPRVTDRLPLAISLKVNHETCGEVQDLLFTPPVNSLLSGMTLWTGIRELLRGLARSIITCGSAQSGYNLCECTHRHRHVHIGDM